MTYEPRWYLCEIGEADDTSMPDFSRVPAGKREEVERRWRERVWIVSRWKLWGPQIERYKSLLNFTVNVLGPV